MTSLDIVKAGEVWQHTTGDRINFLARVTPSRVFPCWVAEDLNTGEPRFVNGSANGMVNWTREDDTPPDSVPPRGRLCHADGTAVEDGYDNPPRAPQRSRIVRIGVVEGNAEVGYHIGGWEFEDGSCGFLMISSHDAPEGSLCGWPITELRDIAQCAKNLAKSECAEIPIASGYASPGLSREPLAFRVLRERVEAAEVGVSDMRERVEKMERRLAELPCQPRCALLGTPSPSSHP